MGLKTTDVRYQADGLNMLGHLAWNDNTNGPAPGVLVFPEAAGLGDHAIERANRLASEFGYVALAADLHGERHQIPMQDVMPILAELSKAPLRVRDRVGAPLKELGSRGEVDASRVAAIGFCFGGKMAFELALTGVDIKAAIGFHSGLELISPGDTGAIKGSVLAMEGAADPLIPPEHHLAFSTAMEAGAVDWQLHVFGGVVHSFTNTAVDETGMPNLQRYDARADARSWMMMAHLLSDAFSWRKDAPPVACRNPRGSDDRS